VHGISLRTATVDDVPAVVSLVESAYRGDASRAGWTTEADLLVGRRTDPAEVLRLITTAGNVILVATSPDGGIVGCCHLQRRDEDTAYFGLFAVRPTAQAGGIGGWLLAAAEERARRDWGATTMEMTVLGQREDLIAWYRRKGYRPTGRTVPWPPSENVRSTPLRDDLYFATLAKPLELDGQAASNG
jgi:GNAT superfamily N-acetyltransferase